MSTFRSTRRLAITALLTLAALLVSGLAESQSIALTFDDGPNMTDSVGMSAAARNAAILKQLADAHLKSILFVTRTDDDPDRNELIRQWGLHGHKIGNHTATHPDFNEVSLADFEQDMLSGEKALQDFPGFTRRFRFPYLKEGNTVEKRDGFRAFLDAHHYRSGAVSVDASDWYYSQRLSELLKDQPNADTRPYRDAYLRHLYDRAQYYDDLSRKVLGRSVFHVLLLHHNLINALYLADVIRMFRDKGWTLVDPEIAFKDPVYAMRPNTLPAGESILWALTKEKGVPGLRYPGEDDTYEKPILDGLAGAQQAHDDATRWLTFIEVKVEARGHAANVLREQKPVSSVAKTVSLQEVSRPERFVLLEVSKPASSGGAREIDTLQNSLADELTAPPDRRVNREFEPDLDATGAKIDTGAQFYVIAHLDLTPSDRTRVETALHQYAAAARHSGGNLGFEVWQQTEHTNHFNLISAWVTESQLHTFEASRAAREFRQVVGPLLGSPYDERLFRRVDTP